MSTLWNTPRGEKLFRISLADGLEDPDAREFPTPQERAELIDASAELMETTDTEQNCDFITTATDFLRNRGTTFHEFSLKAIARVRGQVPVQAARISIDPSGELLHVTTTTRSEETMDQYVRRIEAQEGAWDYAEIDDVIEADDVASAAAISVDRFTIDRWEYEGSTNTLHWPDGRSAKYDTSDIGFWVQDYLFVMNLLAQEQKLLES